MLGSLSAEAIAVPVSVATSRTPAWLQTPTPGLSVLEDGLGQGSEENEAPCLSRCGSFGFTQQSCSENHATTISRRVADPEGRPFVRMVAGHGLHRGFLHRVAPHVTRWQRYRRHVPRVFHFFMRAMWVLHLSVRLSVSRAHPMLSH